MLEPFLPIPLITEPLMPETLLSKSDPVLSMATTAPLAKVSHETTQKATDTLDLALFDT